MLALAGAASCGDDDDPNASPMDGGSDAQAALDAAPIPTSDAGPVSCDLSGIWIGRQTGETSALGPQYPNTWYFWELVQRGTELEVVEHMDCGIEVRGTATVQLTPATTRALLTRNLQRGRKGTVRSESDGTCSVELERFWSVRGVSEDRFAPKPRSRTASLADLKAESPLPPRDQAAMTEDWDGDGMPGIGWQISGIVTGSRNSAQRDWTRYFSAPGYTFAAAADFAQDLVIRAEFEAEEVVYSASGPGLDVAAQVNGAALHTLTLRFFGRSRVDPRAQALIKADPLDTCLAVREALPAVRALR